MYVNYNHMNQRVTSSVYGGAMCLCKYCQEKYWKKKKDDEFFEISGNPEEIKKKFNDMVNKGNI